MIQQICPLCATPEADPFYQDSRKYFRCTLCALVFVPAFQFLSREEEKSVYDRHENSAQDVRYRNFLDRLFIPLSKQLLVNSYGLDFGSGPGPTLSVMFEEAGHRMEIYDPFYAPETRVLEQQYDFITATEVLEHLHHPLQELEMLWSCLKPQGILGIMTKRVSDQQAFSRWHYKNDTTHICFFSVASFQWLAKYLGASLSILDNDVVILAK